MLAVSSAQFGPIAPHDSPVQPNPEVGPRFGRYGVRFYRDLRFGIQTPAFVQLIQNPGDLVAIEETWGAPTKKDSTKASFRLYFPNGV